MNQKNWVLPLSAGWSHVAWFGRWLGLFLRALGRRVLGAFNLNDGRWGRGDEPQGVPNGSEQGSQRPPEGNRRPNASGPPDLDELWRDLNRKLGQLFGNRRGGGSSPPGGGYPEPFKNAGWGLGLVLGLVVLIWLGTGFFIVQEGQQAVITQFGRYHSTVGAGINWRMPYPIQRHEVVFVTQIRSLDIGRDAIIKATGLRESAMLTEDENIVEIKFAVQYRLSDARAWLFESRNPSEAVVQVAESAMREVVGKNQIEPILTANREPIQEEVRGLMQRILDSYNAGITITRVQMQKADPPAQVLQAYRDVQAARTDQERMRNEAEAYANKVVPEARGRAARILQEAEGYKQQVVAEAQGEAQRFIAIYDQYKRAPDVTRRRIYLETMQGVLANMNKVIMDSKGGSGVVPYLPLPEVRAGSGRARGGAPVAELGRRP